MKWSKNEVIYQILVDRFSPVDSKKAKKPIFAGGTLHGISEKINYFVDLGVSAIWLSPIFKGTTYHGHHVTDFMKIDSHFGTLKDFKELIKIFHGKNIKVMIDFNPNHVSSAHPFFSKAIHEKNHYFKKWFYLRSNDTYKTFLDYKELPKLDLKNNFTKQYIIAIAKYWISFGVDGLRLNHAIGPKLSFWKDFKKEIKEFSPDCFLLGEVWVNNLTLKHLNSVHIKNKLYKHITQAKNDKYMKEYQEVFDGCLDFTFNKLIKTFILEEGDKKTFSEKLYNHYANFKSDFFLPTFLDNHDMDRFYYGAKHKEEYKKAIDFMFKQNQPVIIYYGDESGMSQRKLLSEIKEHGDLEVRQPMNWNNMDDELVEYFKRKIKEKLK